MHVIVAYSSYKSAAFPILADSFAPRRQFCSERSLKNLKYLNSNTHPMF